MSLTFRSKLGSYEVLSLLGAGAMGEVYRARDTRLGREVAIKVLPGERMADENRRRRFVQEARGASALSHPNIVTIYEIESADGIDFIVMEYVPGCACSSTLEPSEVRRGGFIAVQQLGTQCSLQPLYLPGNRRWRPELTIGCTGDGPGMGALYEGA